MITCSSTDTHSQITVEAAGAKKHVLCEKPIDYDIDRINKALDAVRKTGINFKGLCPEAICQGAGLVSGVNSREYALYREEPPSGERVFPWIFIKLESGEFGR